MIRNHIKAIRSFRYTKRNLQMILKLKHMSLQILKTSSRLHQFIVRCHQVARQLISVAAQSPELLPELVLIINELYALILFLTESLRHLICDQPTLGQGAAVRLGYLLLYLGQLLGILVATDLVLLAEADNEFIFFFHELHHLDVHHLVLLESFVVFVRYFCQLVRFTMPIDQCIEYFLFESIEFFEFLGQEALDIFYVFAL